jgi:proliferating cell nuclear antigen
LGFQVKIKNVNEWKAALDACKNIADEIMLVCNEDGVSFRGLDPSRVALLNVVFPPSSFVEYDSQSSSFGIRVDDLLNILQSASENDEIEMSIDNERYMKVTIYGKYKLSYNLNLIEKSLTNVPFPKVDYTSKVSIVPNMLNQIFNDVQTVSDFIVLESDTHGINFSATGDTIGSVKIDVEKNNPELISLSTNKEAKSAYSLEYLAKVIRAIGRASKKLDFEYGSGLPIHLQFEMPSTAKVEYFVAPRVGG